MRYGLTIALLLVWVGAGRADDDEYSRATLAGLGRIDVVIQGPPEEIEKDGLTGQQLRTDVELRLRKSGIRVGTTEEHEKDIAGGTPLSVQANIIKNGAGIYAYFIKIELIQVVFVARDSAIVTVAPTWGVGTIGTTDKENLRNIREAVTDQTDRFINAYLTANPVKR